MGCAFCGRDLWDVAKYVSAGPASICADCVQLAAETLRAAEDSDGRELFLPPRTFGAVPDEEAVPAITRAVRAVFSRAGSDERAEYLEDAEQLAPLFVEAAARHAPHGASTRVDRVRFVDDDTAEVRFQIMVGGPGGPGIEGRLIRRGDTWLVTRQTALRVLAMAGVFPH